MPRLRVSFFALAALILSSCSGSTFRCGGFCIDQTTPQEDYVQQRDRCRELALTKIGTDSGTLDSNGRKTQLTTYFSECMAQNGWTVPDPAKEKDKAAAATPAAPVAATATAAPAATAAVVTPAAPNPAEEKAATMHMAECAFARENADVSSIAAARAKACDLECEQALKTAPEAPRPSACPGIFKENLSKGTEKQ